MAFKKTPNPFQIKGTNLVTHTGEAEWCKYLEKQINRGQYSPDGEYSVNLLSDPTDVQYIAFMAKLDGMRVIMEEEMKTGKGEKKLTKAELDSMVYLSPIKEHCPNVKVGDEWVKGEPTGKDMLNLKMKNVDKKKQGLNYVKLIGNGNIEVPRTQCPEIGNGSKIKCKVYANPYYMVGQKVGGVVIPPRYGISLSLQAIKIIDLVAYGAGSGEDFDEDEGITPNTMPNPFDDDNLSEDGDY